MITAQSLVTGWPLHWEGTCSGLCPSVPVPVPVCQCACACALKHVPGVPSAPAADDDLRLVSPPQARATANLSVLVHRKSASHQTGAIGARDGDGSSGFGHHREILAVKTSAPLPIVPPFAPPASSFVSSSLPRLPLSLSHPRAEWVTINCHRCRGPTSFRHPWPTLPLRPLEKERLRRPMVPSLAACGHGLLARVALDSEQA